MFDLFSHDPNDLFTITLSDGTTIENLKLNGNNFVSEHPIEKSVFDGKLSTVTFSRVGGDSQTYENMRLEQIMPFEGAYLILILPIPKDELNAMKIQSDIEYISMMADIDLA